MKSANKVLGKKAVGIEALRRRDRDRQGGRNSSSNNSNYSGSSRPNISSPTASSSASTFSEHGASPLSGLRANSSSRPANSPARTSTNMPMASGPITIDLHRFASDNLQPQESKSLRIKRTRGLTIRNLSLFPCQLSDSFWVMPAKKISVAFTSHWWRRSKRWVGIYNAMCTATILNSCPSRKKSPIWMGMLCI